MENKFAKVTVCALAALFALLGGIIVLTGTLLFATPFLVKPGAAPDFTGTWINASLFGFQLLSYPRPATGQVGADGVPERVFSLPFTALSLVFCLAAPALVLCVAGIFARGCELQRQADETL